MLPFTHAQFIEVFARYNMTVWPAQIVAYILGLGIVLALLRPSAGTGRWVAAGLAAMWLLLFSGLSVIPLLRGSALAKLKLQPR